ncbi:MAG: hypothetical protein CMQ19_14330 [Gammaproteobacteria bacterium]|jgi:outer membrane receptor protein involved in Fe transport|nr:hypothetical protein [Gammaproteobacteria bacterium]|tara:strand:+ start:3970 stop:4335 length:366 start_codon:yes stop_codon:yes gene_type:complete
MAIKPIARNIYGLLGFTLLTPFAPVIANAADYQEIEEIIVTAEKRESTVQDTAIAVSAFNGEAMEARQIATTSKLQFSVPNMMFGKGNFEGSSTISLVSTHRMTTVVCSLIPLSWNHVLLV